MNFPGFTPPFTIPGQEVDLAIDMFENAIREVRRKCILEDERHLRENGKKNMGKEPEIR